MRHDLLSDILNTVKNAEDAGKREIVVPFSGLAFRVLKLMEENGYLEKVEKFEDIHPMIRVVLKGAINNCKAIRPRFKTRKDEYGKWEKRFLPGENIGIIIVSTSQGLMTHYKAREKGIGGRLIAFVY